MELNDTNDDKEAIPLEPQSECLEARLLKPYTSTSTIKKFPSSPFVSGGLLKVSQLPEQPTVKSFSIKNPKQPPPPIPSLPLSKSHNWL